MIISRDHIFFYPCNEALYLARPGKHEISWPSEPSAVIDLGMLHLLCRVALSFALAALAALWYCKSLILSVHYI